jgi:hypothetical protein
MMTYVKTEGKASLYRKESFCGRSTPIVEWIVKVQDQIIRECSTKKDAIVWLSIYSN